MEQVHLHAGSRMKAKEAWECRVLSRRAKGEGKKENSRGVLDSCAPKRMGRCRQIDISGTIDTILSRVHLPWQQLLRM